MSDTVLVAIISGVCTAIPTILLNITNNNKTKALIEYRLKLLEDKQDKHNNNIERTFKLEERCSVFEEQIKVANHRISDLEKGSN